MALNTSRASFSLGRYVIRHGKGRPFPLLTAPSASSRRRYALQHKYTKEEIEEYIANNTPPPANPDAPPRPRWDHTPEGMVGKVSLRNPKDPKRSIWHVNDDITKLDAMYTRLLGRDGDRMLTTDTKWLAVTHKSFDFGRRGYNTRLGYFGRQILALEATRSILASSVTQAPEEPDQWGRTPFEHPALAIVDKLHAKQPRDIISKDKMEKLAHDVGLPVVTRWKPRLPENLSGSGITVVLNTTLYAIIGAISLENGAEVASRVARERILRRLGT